MKVFLLSLAILSAAATAQAASPRTHAPKGRWFFVNLRGSNTLCGYAHTGQFLCFLPHPARYKADHWAFLHQYSVTL